MEHKEKTFLSAVVYIHNAGPGLAPFLEAVLSVLETRFEHAELVCVNDGSTDDSPRVVRELAARAEHVSVTLLNMSGYHGVEAAMNAGVDLAIGDFVFEFDRPVLDFAGEELMRVYNKALEGFDVVSASPDRGERLTSKLFYRVFRGFSAAGGELTTERFRILSRRVINRVGDMNRAVPYRKAAYANCGLKTCNLRYPPRPASGRTGERTEERYRRRLAVDALIVFTEVGYRFSVTMTALMMLVAVLVAVYSVIIYLTSTPVAGWTTTILFLAFAFFGLFGILTIVVKYLQIIVNMLFKRKQYSFESIEKLSK